MSRCPCHGDYRRYQEMVSAPMPTNNTDSTLEERVKWALADDISQAVGSRGRSLPKSGLSKVKFDLQTARVQSLIHSEVTAFAESLEDKFYEIGYDSVQETIDHHLTRYKEGNSHDHPSEHAVV